LSLIEQALYSDNFPVFEGMMSHVSFQDASADDLRKTFISAVILGLNKYVSLLLKKCAPKFLVLDYVRALMGAMFRVESLTLLKRAVFNYKLNDWKNENLDLKAYLEDFYYERPSMALLQNSQPIYAYCADNADNMEILRSLLDNCTKRSLRDTLSDEDFVKEGDFSVSAFLNHPTRYISELKASPSIVQIQWQEPCTIQYTFRFYNQTKMGDAIPMIVFCDLSSYKKSIANFMTVGRRRSVSENSDHMDSLKTTLKTLAQEVHHTHRASIAMQKDIHHVRNMTQHNQQCFDEMEEKMQPLIEDYSMIQAWEQRQKAFENTPGGRFFYQSLSQSLYANFMARLVLTTGKIQRAPGMGENILQGALGILATALPVYGVIFQVAALGAEYGFAQYEANLSQKTAAFFLGCKNYEQISDRIATCITECCLELCEAAHFDAHDPAPQPVKKLVETTLATLLYAITIADRDPKDDEDALIERLYTLFVKANIFHARPYEFLYPIIGLPSENVNSNEIPEVSDTMPNRCCIIS
jgi:hypothetical protein